jgi:hypothetical protein
MQEAVPVVRRAEDCRKAQIQNLPWYCLKTSDSKLGSRRWQHT